jgi:hypothetical protein
MSNLLVKHSRTFSPAKLRYVSKTGAGISSEPRERQLGNVKGRQLEKLLASESRDSKIQH